MSYNNLMMDLASIPKYKKPGDKKDEAIEIAPEDEMENLMKDIG